MNIEVRTHGNMKLYLKQPSTRTINKMVVQNDGMTLGHFMDENFNNLPNVDFIVFIHGRQPGPNYLLKENDVLDVYHPVGGG